VLHHALRNALLPVLTVVGLQVGSLLAGAILTETIFSWPGIGRWVYESIGATRSSRERACSSP
jgi:dipeptide transport system permease protein